MSQMLRQFQRFWQDEDAATATEYAVMLALILLVAIASISALGEKVSATFADANQGW